MTNSPYVKSALAQVAMELIPPLMRDTLLEEPGFREDYGFRVDAALSFDDFGVSFQRSDFFNAIRKFLSKKSLKILTDTDGHKWKLKNRSENWELPILELSHRGKRIILPDFLALSPDRVTRLASFDKAAFDVNLPIGSRNEWRKILAERALEDDEVEAYHVEFRDTPVQKARLIRSKIEKGQAGISTLVPCSRKYFERLVGAYDGSSCIRNYAAGCGKMHFCELSTWQPFEGILFSLLMSSHSSMTAEIDIDKLSNGELVSTLDFLDKHGDRISQLGAIEVAFRVLQSRPEIEPIIIRLIENIRDDDVNGKDSDFKLLSALFVVVDGELSRTRLFSTEPPFYRRLAALSQAALIHRQLVNSNIDIEDFFKWAFRNRGEQFYFQSLTDMRTEPRWDPDLAAASQIKAEFFGRILIAAKNYEQNFKSGELYDLVFGNMPGSLQSNIEFPYPYFPGPLEGAENTQHILPTDISQAIETQLSSEEIKPSSFVALVNSARIFQIDASQAELAAKALTLGNYRLKNLEDMSQLLIILYGLATVAAVARSRALADELRILVRRYRRDVQYFLSIEQIMKICLVAAASDTSLSNWREFVGDWLTELAFGNLKDNEGEVLYSHLQCLCHAVPELWVSCGRADAALIAYNGSRESA
jgi:hypothetical protein